MFPVRVPIITQPPAATTAYTNTYSLSFDGTNDYVDLGSEVNAGTSSTISFWYKHNGDTATRYFTGATSADHFGIRYNGSTILVLIGGYAHADSHSVSLTVGTWYHFVFARTSDTEIDLYIDGTEVDTLSNAEWSGDDTKIKLIGSRADGFFTKGNIDEFAIWDEVLDADAVAAVYNSGAPFDLTADKGNYDNSIDLIAYWRFEEGTGTSAADSAASNTGTLANGVAFSTDVPTS